MKRTKKKFHSKVLQEDDEKLLIQVGISQCLKTIKNVSFSFNQKYLKLTFLRQIVLRLFRAKMARISNETFGSDFQTLCPSFLGITRKELKRLRSAVLVQC